MVLLEINFTINGKVYNGEWRKEQSNLCHDTAKKSGSNERKGELFADLTVLDHIS